MHNLQVYFSLSEKYKRLEMGMQVDVCFFLKNEKMQSTFFHCTTHPEESMKKNLLTELAAHGITIRVREERHAQDISLVELADKSGIWYSVLSEKETGRKHWKILDIAKISHALSVPFAQLIQAVPPPEPHNNPDDPTPEETARVT